MLQQPIIGMDFPNSTGFIGTHGLSPNASGRAYRSGSALSFSEKVTIGSAYLKARETNNNVRPNISALARECKVTRKTILKIEGELMCAGRVIEPAVIIRDKDMPSGPGSIAMSDLDAFILLMIHNTNPSTSLRGYQRGLCSATGTVVSTTTISRFFNSGFEIKGSLCKPTLIPYDKFRPANLDRAFDYLMAVATFDRHRLKFGDEKHIKGAELWCRKTRRNVFTGIVPPVLTHSDFRNTYSIVGFCGIDQRTTPLRYGISQGINDATNFAIQVQLAVMSGFLLPYDVLIVDRAAIHTGGCNATLEDWLWDNYRIFMLLLPARTPEWNPIELVWNILVQRLRTFSLHLANQFGKQSLLGASEVILDNITHKEVDGCFRKSGY